MKRLFLLIALTLFAATSLFAQSKLSNHSRIVINNAKADVKTQADFGIRSVNGIQMVSAFVTFNDAIDASLIAKYGGTVQSEFPANRVVTALLPVAALQPLSKEEGIFYIEVGQKIELQMDSARSASNVDSLITGAAPLTQSYLGRGVILGIIDMGFQLDHPNFWNASHDRYRVKAFWDQMTNTKYMDSAAILNKKYDYHALAEGAEDHATHVLGIAAGADHTKSYYGTAHEADIVAVSFNGTQAGIADAARWISDYAKTAGKPCVINISLGAYVGPHDGRETTCLVLDSLSSPGRVIVCSAGNAADYKLHLKRTFVGRDTLRSMINVLRAGVTPCADIWGEVGMNFSSQFVVVDTLADTLFYATGFLSTNDSITVKHYVINGADTLYEIDGASSVSPLNQKGNIWWTVKVKSQCANLVPGVVIVADSGTVNMWGENATNFVDNGMAGWTSGDGVMTLGNIATANKTIAVGAYNTRVAGTKYETGDIGYFSSRGPTADERVKPEITAPGFKIMSSVTDRAAYDHGDSTVVGGVTYYYGLIDGTSMSSPYVAGVVAAWLEADPTLDYDRLMDIFDHTAMRDNFTGSYLPDPTWGYGKIDAYNGLLYILQEYPASVDYVTDHQIVGIYPNPTADEFRVGFASADNNVTVTVIDLSGRAILSRTLGNVTPGQEVAFSLSDAPTGIYMVRISGSSHTNTYKLVKD